MPTTRKKADKPRPTLGNKERRVMAAMIQSKLPGIEMDWKSGHGRFMTNGSYFASITREGDIAVKLSPERMTELLGNGEVQPFRFGERVIADTVVISLQSDPRRDSEFALQLLREARTYAKSI